jgi:hypothetical protein
MLTELAHLRLAIHARHRGARTDEAALAALTHTLKPGLAAAEAGTGHLHTWPASGPPRMCVLTWPATQAWHGSRADFVFVEHLPGDTEAAAQACRALDALPHLPDFDLHLDVHLTEVRAHLLARGLGIDSVTLIGHPPSALARLPPAPALPPGLHVTHVQPVHHAAIIELQRSYFAAHPEHCWFGAHPTWLQNVSKSLENPKPGCVEVLLSDHEVVGFWGSDFEFDNPLWGRKAGMVVVLDPRFQGRGLVKLAYRRMLEAQVAAGIEMFRGGTSQPPVLGLAAQLGRWPHSVWIRPREKTFFDSSYFQLALG